MNSELPLFYWDANVFLSYINGIADRVQHIEPMMRQSGKDVQIVTSVLSIAEVAFGLAEQGQNKLDVQTEEKINQLWRPGSLIQLVELYELICHDAKNLIRAAIPHGWRLKPPDAIHLATAGRLKVKEFHTYDESLTKYSEITTFRICPPIASQPILSALAADPNATPGTP